MDSEYWPWWLKGEAEPPQGAFRLVAAPKPFNPEAMKGWLISERGFAPYRAQDYVRKASRVLELIGVDDLVAGKGERDHLGFAALTAEARRKLVEAARLAKAWWAAAAR